VFYNKNNSVITLRSREGVAEIDMRDAKIVHLKNALLVEEDKLPQLGIRVGILGHDRSNYDIMLMSSETKEPESVEINKKAMELQKSIPSDKISVRILSF